MEKGPINSCSLVSPYVRDALFSELALTIFLIFCMKLGEHNKNGFLGFFEKTALRLKRGEGGGPRLKNYLSSYFIM